MQSHNHRFLGFLFIVTSLIVGVALLESRPQDEKTMMDENLEIYDAYWQAEPAVLDTSKLIGTEGESGNVVLSSR